MSATDAADESAVPVELLETAREITWPVQVFGTQEGPGRQIAGRCLKPGDVLAVRNGDDVDFRLLLRVEFGVAVTFSDDKQTYKVYPGERLAEDFHEPHDDGWPKVLHIPSDDLEGGADE